MTTNQQKDSSKRKKEGDREMSNAEMDEILAKGAEESKEVKAEKERTVERRTVMNTKVPLHGTWRPGGKDDDNVTFFGANINSLAYWSKESNKAARLRHLFQEYEVDTAGLQEICVN